jgi:hypothetical protein
MPLSQGGEHITESTIKTEFTSYCSYRDNTPQHENVLPALAPAFPLHITVEQEYEWQTKEYEHTSLAGHVPTVRCILRVLQIFVTDYNRWKHKLSNSREFSWQVFDIPAGLARTVLVPCSLKYLSCFEKRRPRRRGEGSKH